MKQRFLQVLPGASLMLLLSPGPAAAQWEGWFQWGTQGSYVHQFAHLLFGLAMLFFIREMYRTGLNASRGFRHLIWSCWILAYWNLDAIIGHSIEWSLANPVIMGHGLTSWLLMESGYSWAFYIFKFDHFFFLIPAFYLFYRGLRIMAARPPGAEP